MCPAGTLCTLTLALGSIAPPARIDPAQSPPPVSQSYSGQLLATDGIVFGSSVLLAAAQPAAGGVLLSAGYLFDGAVVHGIVHHHGLRALESVGLRLGAPLAGFALGFVVSPCGGSSNDFGPCTGKSGGGAVGAFAGALGALLFDDLFLTRD